MLIEKVKKLKPIDRWLYWIKERDTIRERRQATAQQELWTDDLILKSYRFCNVRRMDDKVSSWLYQNWYKPHFNSPVMVANVCIARFLNNIPTLEHIGFQNNWNNTQASRLVGNLRHFRDSGNNTFAAAYVVRGNDGEDKIDSVVNYYVHSAWDMRGVWLDTGSIERSVLGLKACFGYGSFMAGQVVADLRWAVKGLWKDKCTWAAVGPGSARGMNRLKGRPTNQPLKQAQFTDELLELMEVGHDELPESIANKLEAIDWQSTLCEFDKYERTLWEGRRPKQLFRS